MIQSVGVGLQFVAGYLDQRINAKFAKSMSACLVRRLGENAVSHSVPVLGPGTALVW